MILGGDFYGKRRRSGRIFEGDQASSSGVNARLAWANAGVPEKGKIRYRTRHANPCCRGEASRDCTRAGIVFIKNILNIFKLVESFLSMLYN